MAYRRCNISLNNISFAVHHSFSFYPIPPAYRAAVVSEVTLPRTTVSVDERADMIVPNRGITSLFVFYAS